MALLNYTTTVPAARTIAQVQQLLVKAGATQVLMDYADGQAAGVRFAVATAGGTRAFALPVQVERVATVLRSDRQLPPRLKTPEHAERVAWRIVKDWLEAQMALIQSEMVDLEEVMLPYLLATDGRTMFELYQVGQLAPPALGQPSLGQPSLGQGGSASTSRP